MTKGDTGDNTGGIDQQNGLGGPQPVPSNLPLGRFRRRPPSEGSAYTISAAAKIGGRIVANISATVKLTFEPNSPFSVIVWRES
jgi:hypothetical protein